MMGNTRDKFNQWYLEQPDLHIPEVQESMLTAYAAGVDEGLRMAVELVRHSIQYGATTEDALSAIVAVQDELEAGLVALEAEAAAEQRAK